MFYQIYRRIFCSRSLDIWFWYCCHSYWYWSTNECVCL